eukprot:m51a1_g13511 hypothetical protein (225) ;mRNA; r:1403-2077
MAPQYELSCSLRAVVAGLAEQSGRQWSDSCTLSRDVVSSALADRRMREMVNEAFNRSFDTAGALVYDPAAAAADEQRRAAKQEARKNSGLISGLLGFVKDLATVEPAVVPPPPAPLSPAAPPEAVYDDCVRKDLEKEVLDACARRVDAERRAGNRVTGVRTDVAGGLTSARVYYVPLYVVDYMYRGRSYTAVVDGVLGRVGGERPYNAVTSAIGKMFGLLSDKK